MEADTRRILDGKPTDTDSENRVTDIPKDFRDWVTDNEERILAARDRGKEPYFVRDNARDVTSVLKGQSTAREFTNSANPTTTGNAAEEQVKTTPALSIGERAAARHSTRTAEQEKAIKDQWRARRDKLETQSTLNEIAERAAVAEVGYKDVAWHLSAITEAEIISQLGGGDRTNGSCSSLAFAYAGNKFGFNVLDFRGGKSQKFFSSSRNIIDIAQKTGGLISSHTNDFVKAKELLSHVSEGREYYFTCGFHAAVVRKNAAGFYEYLELQSCNDNGWHRLTDGELKNRFGAQKSHSRYGKTYATKECIIEFSLLRRNYGFRKMLGYINTEKANQLKGIGGGEK